MKNIQKYFAIILILFIIISGILPYINFGEEKILKIGVVDSGCSEDQNINGYITFTNTSYGYPSNDRSVYDTLEHGRFVCQIILDNTDNVEIYSAKIAHSSGILTYEGLFAAVIWLAEIVEVDVINLSLGSGGILNEKLLDIFDKYKDSIVFVAASGNTGSTSDSSEGKGDWPAILPWVVGVGSYLDEPDNPAYFTAKGMGYYGIYTSEFSTDGYYEGRYGTSFSTPMITATFVNLMQKLMDMDISYNTNNLIALLSSIENTFDDDIGWSIPNLDNLDFSPVIAIESPEIFKDLTRFKDETWTKRIKISSYDVDRLSEYISFSGNGSNAIKEYTINEFSWGNILEMNISGNSLTSANYLININNTLGNSVTYSFDINSNSNGSILFDHRSSINSYSHQYGEFYSLEEDIRSQGFIVENQFLMNNIDIDNFDAVFAIRFLQMDYTESGTLVRDIDTTLLSSYLEYMNNGGYFLAFTDIATRSRSEDINSFLKNINVEYTNTSITGDDPVSVSNFSKSLLMDGIVNFEFIGQSIRSLDNNSMEIGWVARSKTVGFEKIIEYLPIGVAGNYSLGKFVILGSSYSLTTESYFTIYDLYMNRFIRNLLSEL